MAISNHKITNGSGGDSTSSGAMSNRMYRNVCEGYYIPNNERKHRRAEERMRCKRRRVMKKYGDSKPRGFMSKTKEVRK